MSLYESFLLFNKFRMLLHSSSGAGDCMWVYCSVSVCTGVLVRFVWSRVVSECRLEHWSAPTCIRIPLHSDTTTSGYHYIRIPLHPDTTTFGYHYIRIPLHSDTTTFGYHYIRIPLHSDTTTSGYHYIRIPLHSDTTTSGYHYIRIPPYSSRTAPIHQYTPKQNNTPTYSRQLLRMNVTTFETCWAIKNFHKVTSSWFNLFNYLLHSSLCNKLYISTRQSC